MTVAQEVHTALKLTVERGALWTYRMLGDPAASVLAARLGTDSYPLYERIRRSGPLVRSRLGVYLVSSHALCGTVLRDNRYEVLPTTEMNPAAPDLRSYGKRQLVNPFDDSFLTRNPPDHHRLRRLVSPAFTPRALQARVLAIEAVVDRFLDRIEETHSCDLVADFAAHVSAAIIQEIFGIPEENEKQFESWISVMGRLFDGIRTMHHVHAVHHALDDMNQFLTELIEYRRQHPGNDVISELLTTEPAKSELRGDDLLASLSLLLIASFETVENLISSGTLALLANPEVKERMLAEPEMSAKVVEEVLRLQPIVQYLVRKPRVPVTLADVDISAGTPMILLLAAANRDPEVFTNPDRFDIDRPNLRDHLSFSAGIHHCLGAGLARMQGAIALRRLFQRFPDLRVAGKVRRKPYRLFPGVQRMPITTGVNGI